MIEPSFEQDFEYFPLDKGHWYVYECENTFYDDFTGDTVVTNFFLKEVYDTIWTDASGNAAVRIFRYTRNSVDQGWQVLNVWFANHTNIGAERVEENIRIVKMAFPVNPSTRWNGNAKNFQPAQTFLYRNINREFKTQDTIYPNTVTVVQIDQTSAIDKKFEIEVFSRNIGLVYKEQIDVVAFTNLPQVPNILDKIRAGNIYKQKLIDHGNE